MSLWGLFDAGLPRNGRMRRLFWVRSGVRVSSGDGVGGGVFGIVMVLGRVSRLCLLDRCLRGCRIIGIRGSLGRGLMGVFLDAVLWGVWSLDVDVGASLLVGHTVDTP